MNKVFRIVALLASFGAGFAAGYFVRKKSELKFEEVTEEELAAIAEEDAQNASQSLSEPHEGASGVEDEEEVGSLQKRSEAPLEGIGEGQKIAYFKQWKAEEKREKYDTRTKEEPEDVVTVEDLPETDFIKSIDEDIQNGNVKPVYQKPPVVPTIEPASKEDWNHWVGTQDGEYDPIEIIWYEKDNVFCDSDDEPMDRPERYVGFDIAKLFETEDEDSGNPNVRIVFNHKYRAIYYITRINGSWGEKKQMEEYGGDVDNDDEEDPHERFERFLGIRS